MKRQQQGNCQIWSFFIFNLWTNSLHTVFAQESFGTFRPILEDCAKLLIAYRHFTLGSVQLGNRGATLYGRWLIRQNVTPNYIAKPA